MIRPASRPSTVLAMLVLVYAFNFIDRQILGILAAPIAAELGLSDAQLGALGGLAFALFYTAVGVPVGWIADRAGRSTIIAAALALWSLFTALCGLASGFWHLFLCRVGVGIGEAGGVAPSYALIADIVPPERRGRALAIYSLGIPIGSAAGILFGGWIAAAIDWRAAFFVAGGAGLLIVPLFRLLVQEPARAKAAPAEAPPARLADTIGAILRIPSFWLLALGAASCSLIGDGLMFWLPSFLARSHGLTLGQVALFYGAIVLIGGIAGILAGGWIGDRLAASDRGGYARVPACAVLLAIPCYVAGLTTASLPLAFVLLLIPQALALTWLGPVTAAIQGLVPPGSRATASACFLFVNNLIGIGLGTLLIGLLSDALAASHGAESLRIAALIGLVFYALASVLLFGASRRLERDSVAAI